MTPSTLLRCPLCRMPLDPGDNGLRCASGHSFDRARQGYYHLLPVQKKRSRDPGDAAAMVRGRRSFLEQGHYAPISTALNQLALATLTGPERSPISLRVLDCGCGEGYYSQRLAEALAAAPRDTQATDNQASDAQISNEQISNEQTVDLIGLDISKHAVRYACQRSQQITWIVASGAEVPLPDQSLDLITCLFTPLNGREFHRLLKPGGVLITASTGPDHLLELRQLIYDDIKQGLFEPLQQLQPLFQLDDPQPRDLQRVNYRFQLQDNDSLMQLLMMTPHQWRASAAARQRLASVAELTLTVDVRLQVFRARPEPLER